MRLSWGRRTAWYLAVATLAVTGLIWLLADRLKSGGDAETWQRVSATVLMVHGGAAMAALVLTGMTFEVHMLRAWRSGRNRGSGSVMAAVTAVLIVTAFGLYYSGSDLVRSWVSLIHWGAGLFMPVMLCVGVSYLMNRDAEKLMARLADAYNASVADANAARTAE